MRPFHVMKKDGQWHVYAGNDVSPLCTLASRASAINQARTRSRRMGGRVIVHRCDDDDAVVPTKPLERGSESSSPGYG